MVLLTFSSNSEPQCSNLLNNCNKAVVLMLWPFFKTTPHQLQFILSYWCPSSMVLPVNSQMGLKKKSYFTWCVFAHHVQGVYQYFTVGYYNTSCWCHKTDGQHPFWCSNKFIPMVEACGEWVEACGECVEACGEWVRLLHIVPELTPNPV